MISGPEPEISKAPAYQLADTGKYDVWLVNLRGNIFSRNHAYKDADSSTEYWDFSFEEFGQYDIPCAISHILKNTDD